MSDQNPEWDISNLERELEKLQDARAEYERQLNQVPQWIFRQYYLGMWFPPDIDPEEHIASVFSNLLP